jgi:hypothetical protein
MRGAGRRKVSPSPQCSALVDKLRPAIGTCKVYLGTSDNKRRAETTFAEPAWHYLLIASGCSGCVTSTEVVA